MFGGIACAECAWIAPEGRFADDVSGGIVRDGGVVRMPVEEGLILEGDVKRFRDLLHSWRKDLVNLYELLVRFRLGCAIPCPPF